jgi:hypothetical protein
MDGRGRSARRRLAPFSNATRNSAVTRVRRRLFRHQRSLNSLVHVYCIRLVGFKRCSCKGLCFKLHSVFHLNLIPFVGGHASVDTLSFTTCTDHISLVHGGGRRDLPRVTQQEFPSQLVFVKVFPATPVPVQLSLPSNHFALHVYLRTRDFRHRLAETTSQTLGNLSQEQLAQRVGRGCKAIPFSEVPHSSPRSRLIQLLDIQLDPSSRLWSDWQPAEFSALPIFGATVTEQVLGMLATPSQDLQTRRMSPIRRQ